jgi:glutamyl/glutaminyl-tRNA synthetase
MYTILLLGLVGGYRLSLAPFICNQGNTCSLRAYTHTPHTTAPTPTPTADFGDKWKAWIKATGKATGKKGKGLFHPIRLALTGRMSGPDVGEQVKLLHLAGAGATAVVGLEERVKALKEVLAKHPAPAVAG